MLNEVKIECVELAKGSTAYGIPNLLRSKRLFNKVFWLCFLLLGSAVTSFYIYESVNEYLSFEVVTVIRTEYEQPADFPVVTFCSETNGIIHGPPIDMSNLSKIILPKSKFGYDDSIGSNPYNHFESFISQDYGQCYRFNSGKNMSNHSIEIKKSTIGGRDDSLELYFGENNGLVIFIHNKTLPPRLEMLNNHENPIFISNNSRTLIQIEKTLEYKQPEPYNQCLKDLRTFEKNKTIIKYILNKNQTYKQKNCLEYCFDIIYLQDNPCNCTDTTLGNVWIDCWINTKNNVFKNCTSKYKIEFYKKTLTELCSSYCPLECDSVIYKYSAYSHVVKGSTFVRIYFENLQFTVIEQIPKMKTSDFISNIGGVFGLFVGASFVSLFEIAEILIEMAFILFG